MDKSREVYLDGFDKEFSWRFFNRPGDAFTSKYIKEQLRKVLSRGKTSLKNLNTDKSIVRCFKCNKNISSSVEANRKYEKHPPQYTFPANAIVFIGGDYYGSTVIDGLIDAERIKIVVCDECIKKELENKEKVLQIKL